MSLNINIKRVFFGVLFVTLIPFRVSGGGDMATEGTQTANGVILALIQFADKAIQEASETIEDYERIAHMSFKNLPFVREILPIIEDAKNIVDRGNELAYGAADLEQTMKDKFKNYDDYLKSFASNPTRSDFETAYGGWANTHNNNVRNILKAQGFHASQFDDDEIMLKTLKKKSKDAKGRMQVLQVGQQIATEEVNQLQILKQMMIEQTNLHAGYFANKQAQQSYREAAEAKFFEGKNATVINDGKGYR